MKTLLRLSKLIAPLFPVMLLAVVLGTAGHLCAIGIPLLGALSLFGPFPVRLLVLVGLLRGVLHYAEQYCNHFIAFKILARIRHVVFEKLRSLGPARLDTKEKGGLVALITSDIELLEVFYAHTVSPVCIAVLVTACMELFFVRFHWSLAVLALCFYALVGVAVPLVVAKKSVASGAEYRALFAGMNSFLLDSLRGLGQTIVYGNGGERLCALRQKSDELSGAQKKMAGDNALVALLSGVCVPLAAVCMAALSLALYARGTLGLDAVVLCVVAMTCSFGPVAALASLGSGLSATVASGRRVLSLLDERPVTLPVTGGACPGFDGARLGSVSFRYDKKSGQDILCGVSMDFARNTLVGIKGKSGSGKSTVLKLLMRWWQADRGTVALSGTDVNGIDSAWLKTLEGYVGQETVLFHDTIANNIRIAKLDATDDEVVAACKKASIHDSIMELPGGYQTQVAELGDNFSGGERQRLALARVFLHGAPFILLDEPTSNLDAYNERNIMDAVKAELDAGGKTAIIVSHRDSTFVHADAVYELASGRSS